MPDFAHGDQQQGRGHQHRRRYRDAVGGGEVVGLAEPDGERNGDDHQHPVDRADIDLPVALRGCLGDLEPREPAELDRLAGHGKRAGDDGLAGDDRRRGGEGDHRHQERRRAQPVEDVLGGHALVEHDGGLAGVIEHQARKHDGRPRQPDRPGAEMAHVGVERLGAGDAEEDAAQDGEARESAMGEIGDRVARVEPEQHRGVAGDAPDAQQGDGGEPGRHHRAEGLPDARGSLGLNGEQRNQDRDRGRHHIGAEPGRRDGQAFEGREHGNRRRDGAVAVDEGRAEQAQRDDRRPLLALDPQQRHQSEDAAFAVIVDPHRDGDVFDAGDRDQRPHDQGQHPEHGRPAAPAGEIEHGLERVERAGADVAEHDAERRKPQCRDAAGRTRIALLHEVTAAAAGNGGYGWRMPHPVSFTSAFASIL